MPAESSCDPSSTAISSQSLNVWPRMLSTAAGRYRAALNTGMTTEIRGGATAVPNPFRRPLRVTHLSTPAGSRLLAISAARPRGVAFVFGGLHGGMGVSPMLMMFDSERRSHGRDAHATIAKNKRHAAPAGANT